MSFDEEIASNYDNPINFIIDHSDVILNNSDLIYSALEENLHRVDKVVGSDALRNVLAKILNEDIKDYDTAMTVSSAIISSIRYYYHYDTPEKINEELSIWLKECNIKFEAEIDQSLTMEYVGPQGWTNIETDLIVDDPEVRSVNFNHNVKTINNEFSFTSTPGGLLGLTNHLLKQLKEASRYNAITDNELEDLRESFEDMVEHHYSNNERTDLVMESLLSDTDLTKEDIGELDEQEIYERLEENTETE